MTYEEKRLYEELSEVRALLTAEIKARQKAEAELAEVQGIARESMARFDELHSMLKEAIRPTKKAHAQVER